jgi:hypothetical protein
MGDGGRMLDSGRCSRCSLARRLGFGSINAGNGMFGCLSGRNCRRSFRVNGLSRFFFGD